jgi:hypothetical protein
MPEIVMQVVFVLSPILAFIATYLSTALILQKVYIKAFLEKKILVYRDFLDLTSIISSWLILVWFLVNFFGYYLPGIMQWK